MSGDRKILEYKDKTVNDIGCSVCVCAEIKTLNQNSWAWRAASKGR